MPEPTVVDGALAAASRAIEGYCGRQFNDAGSATAHVKAELALLHVRCSRDDCTDLHWVCSCLKWQGSRILSDETNRKEWNEHVKSAHKRASVPKGGSV